MKREGGLIQYVGERNRIGNEKKKAQPEARAKSQSQNTTENKTAIKKKDGIIIKRIQLKTTSRLFCCHENQGKKKRATVVR